MSKKLYVSRDRIPYYNIWRGKPKWNPHAHWYEGGYKAENFIELRVKLFKAFFPQIELKPGQLAKVERDIVEVYTDFPKVAVFTLGDIVEDRSEK